MTTKDEKRPCAAYVEMDGDYYRTVCDGCRHMGERFASLRLVQEDADWHNADALEAMAQS